MITKFNPENKELLTMGESLGVAMEIIEQDDADQYFNDYVAYIRKALQEEPRDDDMTPEQIAKINLGYYAGYCDQATRIRVEKLFNCTHPYFGKASEGIPTPKEAFNMGKKLATKEVKV